MKTSNRKSGNDFEAELCEKLSEYGFWVHNMAQNKAGQPADIIAVKNGKAYLIDAKVCSSDSFPLSRIEENQDMAMSLWKERGNGEGWFAFKFSNLIYFMPHVVVMAYKNFQSTLPCSEIYGVGMPIEKWVKKCK